MDDDQTTYRHVEMPFGGWPEPDVVDVLYAQHMLIRDLMAEVLSGGAEQRRQSFPRLLALLSVHETAEEEVVHPAARKLTGAEGQVVDDRVAEEHSAKELLEQLDGMDPTDPGFDAVFTRLRASVLDHAISEQRYELNRIRQHVPSGQRAAMRTLVQAAEKTAPTHPHPGVESATENLLLGPPAALIDRARDAIRAARDQ